MIDLKNVVKSFDGERIINDLNLHVKKGERVCIIGPSGCGKSTTLRLILGLQPIDGGEVNVLGEDISGMSFNEIARIRQRIGMVFQSGALFDSMTVGENVGFVLKRNKLYDDKTIKRIVNEKLEMVDLAGTASQMPADLSGGMRKRVAVARAIAADPDIILYDEPTTGLDPITSTVVENLINKLNKELGITSIIVTHQISTIFNSADRIEMMYEGKVIPAGSPVEAKKNKNPVIYNFLNGIVTDERMK